MDPDTGQFKAAAVPALAEAARTLAAERKLDLVPWYVPKIRRRKWEGEEGPTALTLLPDGRQEEIRTPGRAAPARPDTSPPG